MLTSMLPLTRLVVIAPILLIALTACTSAGTTPSLGPAADASAPVQPRVPRVVLATDPPRTDSVDVYAQSGPDLWPMRVMYEYLIGLDPENGKLVPQLATAWNIEPDGKSIRFHLRQDVRFHGENGGFTSRDLLPTLQARTRDELTNSPSLYWKRTVDKVEAVGDYEALYRLKLPDGNFFNSISEQRGIMEIFSRADHDRNGLPTAASKMPLAGTGPYQYSEGATSAYLRFKRVPYEHWRTTPDFPEFEWRWVKEASTRMAALLAGEVHLASLPQDLLVQAERQGMKRVAGRVPGLRTFMSFYCCYPNDINDASKGWVHPDSPLMDARVRQALSKAIDRDALNKAFFGGKASNMVLNHYLPSRDGWNPDWEQRFPQQYGFDAARARQLLTEAGFGSANPLRMSLFSLPASGFAGAQDLGEAIAGNWRSVGAQVELLPIDAATLAAGSRQLRYANHVTINSTSSDQSTGSTNYGSTLGLRGSGYELVAADKLMLDLSNTLDEKKQTELWRRAGDLWYDQFQSIPLFWLPTEIAVNPNFVADYVFPGSITGTWTHVQNIKAARQ